MDKIQVKEEITDYKGCIFYFLCKKPVRLSDPYARCRECSSYSGTLPKFEEIYFEVFQEPCDG